MLSSSRSNDSINSIYFFRSLCLRFRLRNLFDVRMPSINSRRARWLLRRNRFVSIAHQNRIIEGKKHCSSQLNRFTALNAQSNESDPRSVSDGGLRGTRARNKYKFRWESEAANANSEQTDKRGGEALESGAKECKSERKPTKKKKKWLAERVTKVNPKRKFFK